MGLKSKEWFFKQCLTQVEKHDRFCYLAWNILKKGPGQGDSTRGHVTQAIGATQIFLTEYSKHRTTISKADPTLPFDVGAHQQIQTDLRDWLGAQQGEYGKKSFGYSFDTLKGLLTPTLGGTRKGGGGGDDEFKRVLRLMAEFID